MKTHVRLLDQTNIHPWLQHIATTEEEKSDITPTGLKGATLFSGMGGSAWGMQKAGIEEVFFNDFEKHAIDSLRLAFPGLPDEAYSYGDICELPDEAPLYNNDRIFMLQASPPCQDFSTLNTQTSAQAFTERNQLFMEALRICDAVRPAVFVLENVPGFYSNKKLFFTAMKMLYSMGYLVRSWKLTSDEYGARQARPRFWVVAYDKKYGVAPQRPKVYRERAQLLNELVPNVSYLYFDQFGGKLLNAKRPVPTITKTPNMYFVRTEDINDMHQVEIEKELAKRKQVLFIDDELITPSDERALVTYLDEESMAHLDETSINTVTSGGDFVVETPTLQELLVMSDFPPDWPMYGESYLKMWNRIGNIVIPTQMEAIARTAIEDLSEEFLHDA
jgi:DNA-cytosine methyltransferase